MTDDGDAAIERALQDLPPEVAARVRAFVEESAHPVRKGDPRRHHFLAQFYSARFADEDGRVAVINLDAPKDFKVVNVANVAVINDFYTVVDNDGNDTVAVEKVLALVDGEASSAFARLAFGVLFPPTKQDRLHLALWFAAQHVRDPHARRNFEAIAETLVKLGLPQVLDEAQARDFLRERHGREPTDADARDLVEAVDGLDEWEVVPSQNDLVKLMLESCLDLAPHFWGRCWTVIKFSEPGLVTCDRPIVLFQHPENRRPFEGVGIGTADEISISLDRRTLLVMHTDRDFGDCVIPAPGGYTTRAFNQMVVQNARAEIYCHPDDVENVLSLDLPPANRPVASIEGGAWGGRPYPDGVNASPKRQKPRRYAKARNYPR
jgi:hypothetical protein